MGEYKEAAIDYQGVTLEPGQLIITESPLWALEAQLAEYEDKSACYGDYPKTAEEFNIIIRKLQKQLQLVRETAVSL